MLRKAMPACAISLILATTSEAKARLSPEFQVNTYATFGQRYPNVAMTGAGTFIVVWESQIQDGSANGVFGRRVRVDGSKLGAEFQVNTYTTNWQYAAKVAAEPGGGFLVVWQHRQREGFGNSVIGRRFSPAGAPLGGELLLNAPGGGQYRRSLSIARQSNGGFVVAWEALGAINNNPGGYAHGPDGSGTAIQAQLLDANGQRVGGEFQVNTTTVGYQIYPSVATDPNGNFFVCWGGASAVDGQMFDANGVRIGSEFAVSTPSATAPAVVNNGSGFLVVWQQAGSIFARRFDSNGGFLGSEFQVNTTTATTSYRADVAASAGGFVVTWQTPTVPSYADIRARSLAADGTPLGVDFVVNVVTQGHQSHSALGLDPAGRSLVAWTSYPGDASGLGVKAAGFSHRFSGAPTTDYAAKALDFHADGMSDLLWYNTGTGELSMWRMNGTTVTTPGTVGTVADTNWRIVAGGDFGGDTRGDVIWRNSTTGSVYLWQLNGSSVIATNPVSTVADLNWEIVGSGDVDADGRADLFWQNQSTGVVILWRMSGPTILSTHQLTVQPDLDWRMLGTRDFNADGRADALWRNRITGQVYIWLMAPTAVNISVHVTTENDASWEVVGAGDFNADGHADLVAYHRASSQVNMWLTNQGRIVSAHFVANTGNLNMKMIETGDFNADGRLDLVWHDAATGQVTIWLMNGPLIASTGSPGTIANLNIVLQGLR
jgi:hypothetical protein